MEQLHCARRDSRLGVVVTHWTLEPLQVVPVLLLAALYAKRVPTLRERGAAPPALAASRSSRSGSSSCSRRSSRRSTSTRSGSFGLHMTQHILLGDLAPLALLGGVTGPVLRPLLRFVHPLRRIFHPVAALAALGDQPLRLAPAVSVRGGAAPRRRCTRSSTRASSRAGSDVDAGARDDPDARVVRHRREARVRRGRPRRLDGARQHLRLAEHGLLLLLRARVAAVRDVGRSTTSASRAA